MYRKSTFETPYANLRNKEINSPIAVLVGGAKYMMTHGLSFTVMPDQGVDMNAVRGIIGGDLRPLYMHILQTNQGNLWNIYKLIKVSRYQAEMRPYKDLA